MNSPTLFQKISHVVFLLVCPIYGIIGWAILLLIEVKQLVKCFLSFIVIKNRVRDICHIAKQRKLSFPLGSSFTTTIFELIHADIWGPIFVMSIHGHSYFLTIVDDYSRHTWIYLLKNKTKVKPLIQAFCALVKNQTIRIDNGKEFKLDQFYATRGIVHQTSCVETP